VDLRNLLGFGIQLWVLLWYARVSTHVGQSPEMQIAELQDYCQRHGWEVAGEYMDVGISGAKERRPELDRLLVECRKRKVDAVVVYRYDRFARSRRRGHKGGLFLVPVN